jgi:hypothetical protein
MNRKQFVILLVAVIAAGLVGGFVSDRMRGQTAQAQEAMASAKVIQAQEFRMVTESGETRARLTMLFGKQAYLLLCDDKGQGRISLSLSDDQTPFISLADSAGKTRAMYWLTRDGSPMIDLWDENEVARITLGKDANDKWAMLMTDTAGNVTWRVPQN